MTTVFKKPPPLESCKLQQYQIAEKCFKHWKNERRPAPSLRKSALLPHDSTIPQTVILRATKHPSISFLSSPVALPQAGFTHLCTGLHIYLPLLLLAPTTRSTSQLHILPLKMEAARTSEMMVSYWTVQDITTQQTWFESSPPSHLKSHTD
jgi:hypothetical protein